MRKPDAMLLSAHGARQTEAPGAAGQAHLGALLQAVFDSLPDPVLITDAQQRMLVSNRRAKHLLTLRDGDGEGRRRAIEINKVLFRTHLLREDELPRDATAPRELNLVDPETGEDLLFEVMTHPMEQPPLPAGARLSALRDVTDLKQASMELERQFERLREAEMRSSRERDRLNMILDSVADPILVTDERARIVLMNPPAEHLLERGAAQHHSKHAQRVQANSTQITALVTDFATSSATYRRERLTVVDPDDGRNLPVEILAGKILNERGDPQAIVSVLHDLTQQVENERLYQEVKRFNEELADRVRVATQDLEAQNRRLLWQSSELEKASRLKSAFLANMSHELRTPINALLGYASLMQDRIYGELTPQQTDALDRIASSSQHLLALINDILDLARIEAGKMPLHIEEVELDGIVASAATEMEPLARAKALRLEWFVSAMPPMQTDRTKVRQIVLNLLSNAIKFTHTGSVMLRAEREGDWVRLSVTDTGVGIQPQDLELIFEEFRQADQSRTRVYPGTGLGLSITRKLLNLLRGSISVTSTPGVGSTFTVRIPWFPGDEPQRA